MPTLSIRLPDSLHKAVIELAEIDHVSMNHFIAYALTEKVASIRTIDYFKHKAAKADMKDFDALLQMVPAVEPEEYDRLPKTKKGKSQ